MGKRLLVADIGGTSSRFANFEVGSDTTLCHRGSVWFKTEEFSSFVELLGAVEQSDLPFRLTSTDYSVFAVAGPVRGGFYCDPPNINWQIDLSTATSLGIGRFSLINDFLATAFACASPLADGFSKLRGGKAQPEAARAVIGAGTGLGKAVLYPDGSGSFLGMPSEGGHTNFCAESDAEFEFQRFVCSKLNTAYAVWDSVVSGRGLSLIHEFLSGEVLSAEEVSGSNFEKNAETLRWFSRFYGRVCRNFVLESLAGGGLYIAGGIAAKNPKLVSGPEFNQSFCCSDNYGNYLSEVPVLLVQNEDSGLWGAAYYGMQQLGVCPTDPLLDDLE